MPADEEDEEGDRGADEDTRRVILGVIPDVVEIIEDHGDRREHEAGDDAENVLGLLRDVPTENT